MSIPYSEGWQSVPYNAGNFGSPSGAWTVDSGDQTTYEYIIFDSIRLMIIQFVLDTTSVTGTPSELYIAIPAGKLAKNRTFGFFQAIDNGSSAVGPVRCEVNDVFIRLQSTVAGAGWSASTNNTFTRGVFILEFQ